MRESQLTRHDIGREQFVSEVSSNYHLLISSLFPAEKIVPFMIFILFYCLVHSHLYLLLVELCCDERSGIGKTSMVEPF